MLHLSLGLSQPTCRALHLALLNFMRFTGPIFPASAWHHFLPPVTCTTQLAVLIDWLKLCLVLPYCLCAVGMRGCTSFSLFILGKVTLTVQCAIRQMARANLKKIFCWKKMSSFLLFFPVECSGVKMWCFLNWWVQFGSLIQQNLNTLEGFVLLLSWQIMLFKCVKDSSRRTVGLHNQPHSIITGNCIFRETSFVDFVPSL